MKRILIVEDDQAIGELEQDYLVAAGLEVEVVGDGARALEAATREGWDLFVVDLMLPGLDGFSLCAELRRMSPRPIIVVSALGAEADKVRALGLGADDFVTKPFGPAELVARVRAHLERYDRVSGGQASSLITHLGLTIDPEKKTVSLGGKNPALTPTEYSLLLILASSPGRIYSKEELFELVRGQGFYGETSAITVHIRRLREKIEKDPSNPRFVETVWGMGYRFAED